MTSEIIFNIIESSDLNNYFINITNYLSLEEYIINNVITINSVVYLKNNTLVKIISLKDIVIRQNERLCISCVYTGIEYLIGGCTSNIVVFDDEEISEIVYKERN